MPDPAIISRLRGLVLSSTDVRELTGWSSAMIEDYLNLVSNIITIAEALDNEAAYRDAEVTYASGNYNILKSDEKIYILCTSSDITVTLPADAGTRTYHIEKIDSTEFKGIVQGQSGELINGETTFELLEQYESVKPTKTDVVESGSDWMI